MINPLVIADDFIINILDKGTTELQQRGWIPLHTLRMIIQCALWSALVATTPVIGLVAPVGAFCLFAGFLRWQYSCGYWESPKKTQELNAVSQSNRDNKSLRLFMSIVMLWVILGEFLIGEIESSVGNVCLILSLYLECCKFVGPGEYASKKWIFLNLKTSMR